MLLSEDVRKRLCRALGVSDDQIDTEVESGNLAAPTSSKFHSFVLGLRSIVSVVCSFVKPQWWFPIRRDLVRAAR